MRSCRSGSIDLRREHWVREDCAAIEDKRLYEPDPSLAWERLRGIAQLPPAARARAKAIANWREKLARSRDLPRAWILADAALFSIAQGNPASSEALERIQPMNDKFAATLLEAMSHASGADESDEPSQDLRPDAGATGLGGCTGQNRRCARGRTANQRRSARAARRVESARHGKT